MVRIWPDEDRIVNEVAPGPSRLYLSVLLSVSEAETALPTFCPDRVSSSTLSSMTASGLSKDGLLLLGPVVPRPYG